MIDLRNITLGFDPRLHDMAIDLRNCDEDDFLEARFSDPDGPGERHITGERGTVLAALRRFNGFCCSPETRILRPVFSDPAARSGKTAFEDGA